ncbi:GntR family transcriptional regulator [Arthrobacter sp. GMC3]|uniref:GntR family transcriptional regulator n=1 Tax=Arthrobacter sp. GMC3 TaxID=2058894 RepID=UPI000CE35C63|nr:GntR family transcriptional regulator [Arthrobacter sp. GMC3]
MLKSESIITPDNSEPLWMQTVNLIKDELAANGMAPGTRLRSERELTERWNISRVTLRKALQHLVSEGVLSSSHGRGWYVSSQEPSKEFPNSLESFSETAERMGLVASAVVVRETQASATMDEAESLGIAPGTPVLRLERIRKMDDVVIAVDTSVVPLALLPDIAGVDFAKASLFGLLGSAGASPDRADATIESVGADEATSGLLNVAPGTPLLVMRQVTTGRDHRPVALSTISYVGERYRLRTNFSRSR